MAPAPIESSAAIRQPRIRVVADAPGDVARRASARRGRRPPARQESWRSQQRARMPVRGAAAACTRSAGLCRSAVRTPRRTPAGRSAGRAATGRDRLKTIGEPSMRLTCSPAANATAPAPRSPIGTCRRRARRCRPRRDDGHRLGPGRTEAHALGVERVGDDDGGVRVAVARRDQRGRDRSGGGRTAAGRCRRRCRAPGVLTAPAAK